MQLGGASDNQRHFGLDWLRIGAFVLVIFHHISMVFGPDGWVIKARELVELLIWPMLALQPWRMALLFAVSGYATHALLTRSAGLGGFAALRSRRLLLPLLFGMLVLIPPQSWVRLSAHHQYGDSLWHFWTHDWGRSVWGGASLPATEHLWFLAYLWTYTMLLVIALAVAPAALRNAATSLREGMWQGTRLLWAPLAPLLALRVLALFTVPETHGVLHDWVSDITYLPAFLFGFTLAASPGGWGAVIRARRPALAGAAASLALLILLQWLYPGERGHFAQALDRDASLVMAWSMILLLFGAAHQWLDRDHRLRRPLCEAVFPCFLVHHTIIVLSAWYLRDLAPGNATLFAALTVLTVAGCWAFYAVGSGFTWLRPFVGLGSPRGGPAHDRSAVSQAAPQRLP